VLRAPATPSEPAAVPDYAENDSGAAIRDDLVHGTTLPPDFTHAARSGPSP
jgi:hypothetical protein